MDTQAKAEQQLEMKRVALHVFQQMAAEYVQQIQAIANSGDACQMADRLPYTAQRLGNTLRDMKA